MNRWLRGIRAALPNSEAREKFLQVTLGKRSLGDISMGP